MQILWYNYNIYYQSIRFDFANFYFYLNFEFNLYLVFMDNTTNYD